ncbi:MAG: STAS domain-containing protein [Nitrospinales bacterium]
MKKSRLNRRVAVLKLKGRLDTIAIQSLKNKIGSLMDSNQIRIVLDMEQIDFIDSAGLGGLASAYRAVSETGGEIKIASLQKQIEAIFELARMHQLFEIFDDPISAAESF